MEWQLCFIKIEIDFKLLILVSQAPLHLFATEQDISRSGRQPDSCRTISDAPG